MTHCNLGEVAAGMPSKAGTLESAKSHSSHAPYPNLPCYQIYDFWLNSHTTMWSLITAALRSAEEEEVRGGLELESSYCCWEAV